MCKALKQIKEKLDHFPNPKEDGQQSNDGNQKQEESPQDEYLLPLALLEKLETNRDKCNPVIYLYEQIEQSIEKVQCLVQSTDIKAETIQNCSTSISSAIEDVNRKRKA